MTTRRGAIAMLLPMAAGGCAALGVLDRDPPRIYRVTLKTNVVPPPPETGRTLIVEVPTAATGLSTTRIALRPQVTSLDYYANSLWVDVVPVMVQRALVETLNQVRVVEAVPAAEAPEDASLALTTDIMAFQADYNDKLEEPPIANVRLRAELLRLPQRRRLARKEFRQSEVRAQGTSVAAVTSAIDEAFGKVQRDLVGWIGAEVRKAGRSK